MVGLPHLSGSQDNLKSVLLVAGIGTCSRYEHAGLEVGTFPKHTGEAGTVERSAQPVRGGRWRSVRVLIVNMKVPVTHFDNCFLDIFVI